MHFTKAKMAIITNCLPTDFLHGTIAGILLALVHSTEPTRFNSQRVQPGDMAIHPICTRNRVRQTPIAWQRISIRFNHVRPTGGSRRTSRQRKQCWLCRIRNISCVQLGGSGRFTDGCFLVTCMLRCCGSLQRSRLPLTEQQVTTNQLQLKQHKGIVLHLQAMISPLFSTRVTYMHSMFFHRIRILIHVS